LLSALSPDAVDVPANAPQFFSAAVQNDQTIAV
jgi:hypothetical protein